jgi:Flp pilus assembly pilin Flp
MRTNALNRLKSFGEQEEGVTAIEYGQIAAVTLVGTALQNANAS